MGKITAALLTLALILSIGGCASPAATGEQASPTAANTDTASPAQTETATDWAFYNQKATAFVEAMAGGDFAAAAAMFDATMSAALSPASLEKDVWNAVTAQAGAFVGVESIENLEADGYYICFTASRHENRGVVLRIVFSAEGQVAGLFVEDYPALSGDVVQREGFSDIPVIIGAGTDYPLNGILSMPDKASGQTPAVVLVHGSGPQDMDETLYGNKPFRDIAEYLAANGIAALRYDKRSFAHGAAMTADPGSVTVYEETIEDAILAAHMLKNDSRINGDKVFILGHSLGGMLATRIHAEGGDFAGIISLAGSPRSLLDIMIDQSLAVIEATMTGEEKAAALSQGEIEGQATINSIRTMTDQEAKNEAAGSGVTAYYYKEMDAHPVSAYLDDVQIPFLILQGEADFQVYAHKDFTAWQELLAGRTNATFTLYQGLNHLFMTSAGMNITQYQEEYQTAGTVNPQVLTDIAGWIQGN